MSSSTAMSSASVPIIIMATITEQKAELTILHKSGVIAEATYINLMSALNAQLGSDLRISTQGTAISLNVPPLQQVLEKPKKNLPAFSSPVNVCSISL